MAYAIKAVYVYSIRMRISIRAQCMHTCVFSPKLKVINLSTEFKE